MLSTRKRVRGLNDDRLSIFRIRRQLFWSPAGALKFNSAQTLRSLRLGGEQLNRRAAENAEVPQRETKSREREVR
jgi:hypothetical protein